MKYWLAINSCQEIGSNGLRRLSKKFKSMKTAWRASFSQYKQAGLKEKQISAIKKTKKEVDPDEELAKVKKEGIKVITFKAKNFPESLKNIPSPPAILYYKGNIENEEKNNLAVVGTRRMTLYGSQITEKLIKEIATVGINIVSGLALGVDAQAHRTTLENKGKTIGILGCGIDERSIYPLENRGLAQKIIESGGVIASEFHINTPPLKHHFPMRNRLISGLSRAVLVVECPERSGALITARTAIEQGKEVMAVPGDIRSPNAKGPNNLIKLGAKPVTETEDILEEFKGIELDRIEHKIIADNQEEESILNLFSEKPLLFDKIVKRSGLNTAKTNSVLTMLEIKGRVRNVGMNKYILRK